VLLDRSRLNEPSRRRPAGTFLVVDGNLRFHLEAAAARPGIRSNPATLLSPGSGSRRTRSSADCGRGRTSLSRLDPLSIAGGAASSSCSARRRRGRSAGWRRYYPRPATLHGSSPERRLWRRRPGDADELAGLTRRPDRGSRRPPHLVGGSVGLFGLCWSFLLSRSHPLLDYLVAPRADRQRTAPATASTARAPPRWRRRREPPPIRRRVAGPSSALPAVCASSRRSATTSSGRRRGVVCHPLRSATAAPSPSNRGRRRRPRCEGSSRLSDCRPRPQSSIAPRVRREPEAGVEGWLIARIPDERRCSRWTSCCRRRRGPSGAATTVCRGRYRSRSRSPRPTRVAMPRPTFFDSLSGLPTAATLRQRCRCEEPVGARSSRAVQRPGDRARPRRPARPRFLDPGLLCSPPSELARSGLPSTPRRRTSEGPTA